MGQGFCRWVRLAQTFKKLAKTFMKLSEASQKLGQASQRLAQASQRLVGSSFLEAGSGLPEAGLGLKGGGRTDVRTYGRTDVQTYRFPLCSTGLRPPLGPKPKPVAQRQEMVSGTLALLSGLRDKVL